MTSSTNDQVAVATDILRSEAGEWDRQSAAIATVAPLVAGMELGRVEAGLFQLIVGPYNEIIQHVTDRCRQGQAAMAEVATTLRQVADTYEEEDRNAEHRIRNLY